MAPRPGARGIGNQGLPVIDRPDDFDVQSCTGIGREHHRCDLRLGTGPVIRGMYGTGRVAVSPQIAQLAPLDARQALGLWDVDGGEEPGGDRVASAMFDDDESGTGGGRRTSI